MKEPKKQISGFKKEIMAKKHFKKNEPTVRNRSAVIHAALSIKFISKEQCELFVKDIVSAESYPQFSVETIVGDSLTPDLYVVTLDDICWANNITRIAKILEKYDYNNNF